MARRSWRRGCAGRTELRLGRRGGDSLRRQGAGERGVGVGGVDVADEQRIKVLDGEDLALRDVAKMRRRREEDRLCV